MCSQAINSEGSYCYYYSQSTMLTMKHKNIKSFSQGYTVTKVFQPSRLVPEPICQHILFASIPLKCPDEEWEGVERQSVGEKGIRVPKRIL